MWIKVYEFETSAKILPQCIILFFRVDSVMLLEDGFEVVSSDASDKMLKTAYKLRWDRRRETAFDNWSTSLLIFLFFQLEAWISFRSIILKRPFIFYHTSKLIASKSPLTIVPFHTSSVLKCLIFCNYRGTYLIF